MTSPEPIGETSPIPFALPDITDAEIEAVTEVLRSRWLTTGAKTREFESEFASVVQAPHAVALNSCTAALHLSLDAFGVGPGDLVFVPTYTFAASGEVVRYVGATPVLVDVDPVTCTIDVADLRRRIDDAIRRGAGRPRAIIPVHFSGVASDLSGLWEVAREFGLCVIEDAAHAFPSTYEGRPIGWTPEDVPSTVCFSFYATKTITTGEGGMVTTRDEAIADRIRLMSLHGLSKQAWNRYSGGGWRYDITAPGYKYNLTDIASAIGLVQLSRAKEMASRRAEIAATYDSAFGSHEVFEVPAVPVDRDTSRHLYPLRLRSPLGETQRDAMIERLGAEFGIGVSMHFIPLHLHTHYRDTYGHTPRDFPAALDTFRRSLSLPIWSAMTEADVERVVAAVLTIGESL